jgi:hypothetical protein
METGRRTLDATGSFGSLVGGRPVVGWRWLEGADVDHVGSARVDARVHVLTCAVKPMIGARGGASQPFDD